MAARKNAALAPLQPDRPAQVMTVEQALAGMDRPEAVYDPGELEDDPAAISADLALETTLQQLGEDQASNARVIIYRLNDDKSEEYLYETTPAEFAVEGVGGVAARFGGGQYRARVFLKGGRGFLTQKVFRIAKELKPTISQKAEAVQGAGLGELAATMMQGFQKLGELIVSSQQHAQPQPSRADMLNELLVMKQVFDNPAPAQSGPDVSVLMDMLKQGMELGRMGAGGEPSSMEVLMKAVEAFGPALGAMTGTNQAMPATASIPALAAPAIPQTMTPAPVAVPQTNGAIDEMGMREMMLKQALNFLVSQAERGNDPATYADMVLDQLTDAEILSFVGRSDWLDVLAAVNPRVKEPNVAAWFAQVRALLQQTLGVAADAPGLTPAPVAGISGDHATISHSNPGLSVVPDGHPVGQDGGHPDA